MNRGERYFLNKLNFQDAILQPDAVTLVDKGGRVASVAFREIHESVLLRNIPHHLTSRHAQPRLRQFADLLLENPGLVPTHEIARRYFNEPPHASKIDILQRDSDGVRNAVTDLRPYFRQKGVVIINAGVELKEETGNYRRESYYMLMPFDEMQKVNKETTLLVPRPDINEVAGSISDATDRAKFRFITSYISKDIDKGVRLSPLLRPMEYFLLRLMIERADHSICVGDYSNIIRNSYGDRENTFRMHILGMRQQFNSHLLGWKVVLVGKHEYRLDFSPKQNASL